MQVKDEDGEISALCSGSVFKKATQVISFGAPDKKIYGDTVFTLPATTNKGLPVNYQSTNTEVTSIEGNKNIILNAGTTDIVATQLSARKLPPLSW